MFTFPLLLLSLVVCLTGIGIARYLRWMAGGSAAAATAFVIAFFAWLVFSLVESQHNALWGWLPEAIFFSTLFGGAAATGTWLVSKAIDTLRGR